MIELVISLRYLSIHSNNRVEIVYTYSYLLTFIILFQRELGSGTGADGNDDSATGADGNDDSATGADGNDDNDNAAGTRHSATGSDGGSGNAEQSEMEESMLV